MNDAPSHQARETGVRPDRSVGPITVTLAALFGAVVLTLLLYGLNVSSDRPEMASNAPPAQEPVVASGNTAANNATDKSKPGTGQAKQATGAMLQGSGGSASSPPGATKAQLQSTTASQAPASQAPARTPAGDAPNAAAPVKPDG